MVIPRKFIPSIYTRYTVSQNPIKIRCSLIFILKVPYPLPNKRRQFLASKWLITAARDRSGHNMAKKLATELLEAFNNQVIKRVTNTKLIASYLLFRVLPSKENKIYTDWLKLTEHLLIIDGDQTENHY